MIHTEYVPTKPSKKDIKIWSKALRSGKYKQAMDNLQNEHGFCCLGVACKVFVPEYTKTANGWLLGGIPKITGGAPMWLSDVDYHFRAITGFGLTMLNDGLDFTFDEIADILEAVYIHEVLK